MKPLSAWRTRVDMNCYRHRRDTAEVTFEFCLEDDSQADTFSRLATMTAGPLNVLIAPKSEPLPVEVEPSIIVSWADAGGVSNLGRFVKLVRGEFVVDEVSGAEAEGMAAHTPYTKTEIYEAFSLVEIHIGGPMPSDCEFRV